MPVTLATKGDRVRFTGLKCACGSAHHAPTQDFLIGTDMAGKLPRYLKKREIGQKSVLIADQAGYDASGRAALEAMRKDGFEVTLSLLSAPIADERALGEVMLAMRMDTEFFLGIGSDAVANVARAAAAQTERPLALLVTRPDGCDTLAPEARMALRGEPMTLPAVSPEVVAFDLDALKNAPPEAYAQGLSDLAACHLARADWAAMRLLRGDDYCPLCADLAAEAADHALEAIDLISERSEEGARRMAESILMAGVAAVVSGGARPVSSDAQRIALRAAQGGEPYAATLSGAVTRLLSAYRSFDPAGGDPNGDAAAGAALTAHRDGLRKVLERLPTGETVLAALRKAAPELPQASSPLALPRAASACDAESLLSFAALAGISLFA